MKSQIFSILAMRIYCLFDNNYPTRFGLLLMAFVEHSGSDLIQFWEQLRNRVFLFCIDYSPTLFLSCDIQFLFDLIHK
jgi:hypothetical protein